MIEFTRAATWNLDIPGEARAFLQMVRSYGKLRISASDPFEEWSDDRCVVIAKQIAVQAGLRFQKAEVVN
jgi:hypothetical protein